MYRHSFLQRTCRWPHQGLHEGLRRASTRSLLVAAVATKWDAVVLPGLYVLAWATSENWRSVIGKAAVLFAVSISTYALLRLLLPGGFAEKDLMEILLFNLKDILVRHITYPPVLAFTLPVILLFIGIWRADRYSRASAVFGLLIFLPLFLGTVFREVRAEMIVLIAILPAALHGITRTLDTPATLPSS